MQHKHESGSAVPRSGAVGAGRPVGVHLVPAQAGPPAHPAQRQGPGHGRGRGAHQRAVLVRPVLWGFEGTSFLPI